jgi:hypothetical protein
MVRTVRDSATDTAVETDAIHDLTIDELETVSGGCPCTTSCDCDKPSPRHP